MTGIAGLADLAERLRVALERCQFCERQPGRERCRDCADDAAALAALRPLVGRPA